MPLHNNGVSCFVSATVEVSKRVSRAYAIMLPMATIAPAMDLSATGRPEMAQPIATIVHVLRWPITVLDTGPVWATMKNWDILISDARPPD